MYKDGTCRRSCWDYGKRHRFPLSKKERTYDWRNGKRIHHTLKWTPGASHNLGKKSLKGFYKGHFWYIVTKTRALESTVLKNVCQQILRVPYFLFIFEWVYFKIQTIWEFQVCTSLWIIFKFFVILLKTDLSRARGLE